MAHADKTNKLAGWRFEVWTPGLGGGNLNCETYFVYELDKSRARQLLNQKVPTKGSGVVPHRANLHEFIALGMKPGEVRVIPA
jgi:hypothetical protein